MNKKMGGLLLLVWLVVLVGCGGGETAVSSGNNSASGSTGETAVVSAGDPVAGETKFNEVCIACHGPGGVGIENLGKPFPTSEFVRGSSDEELLTFVQKGRPMSDPANTTGVDMPPKGGNPALTDAQILDIVAYIRTLQQ